MSYCRESLCCYAQNFSEVKIYIIVWNRKNSFLGNSLRKHRNVVGWLAGWLVYLRIQLPASLCWRCRSTDVRVASVVSVSWLLHKLCSWCSLCVFSSSQELLKSFLRAESRTDKFLYTDTEICHCREGYWVSRLNLIICKQLFCIFKIMELVMTHCVYLYLVPPCICACRHLCLYSVYIIFVSI